jgi:hypothetical protein
MTQYYDDTNVKRKRHRRRHPVRKIVFALLLILFIVVGYSRFVEPYLLTTSYMEYDAPQLIHDGIIRQDRSESPNLKIALFADTHFSKYYTTENFENVIERINSENPDIVFFLGDLIDNYSTYEGNVEDIENGLSRINASIGKFAVYGNHDYGGDMQFKYPEVMETGGFTLLVNQTDLLESLNLCILGIDDMLIGYGDPSAAKSLDPNRYNIVICHEPDVFDMMADCDIDLMFAGHTHGRQINLKIFDDFIQPVYGKKYIKGNFDFDNERGSSLFVTSGIGMTKLPLRFGTPPEINIITLS